MIDWDKRGLFSDNIGNAGITIGELRDAVALSGQKLEYLRAHRADIASFIGVLDLPMARQSRIAADSLSFRPKTLVVLGIGGSYAGAAAAIHALRPALDPSPINVIFLPTVDPETVKPVLSGIDPETTLINCVSKSGRTVEIMALYGIFQHRMQAALKDAWKGHFIFTTDPEKGYLRKIARETGVKTLDIPPMLGGRFSVLSPVGLLPMYLAGIDIDAMVEGARSYMAQERPWAVLSAAAHKLLMDKGKSIRTLMTYNDSMESMGQWFAQLWAESLGKRRNQAGIGQTPLLFQGSRDQHSLLQLFMEGPGDKVYTVLRTAGHRADMQVPDGALTDQDVSDLNGKYLSRVFDAEATATTTALMQAGRPVEVLTMPELNAESMGALFAHFMLETAITGLLMGIDPFNQPGVETGKVYAHALLGRGDLHDTMTALQEYAAGLVDFEEDKP